MAGDDGTDHRECYGESVRGSELKNKESDIKGRLIIAALYFIAFCIVVGFLDIDLPENLVSPCMFRLFTGLYCPGCYGTRALRMLLHGRGIISFIYHPALPYMAFQAWGYGLSFAVSRISRGKLPWIKPRPWHFYLLIALIIVNWIVKNILLAGFGITPEILVENIL